MRLQNIVAAASFAHLALAHIPHLDDGTHVTIATAWAFPDAVTTRVLMFSFDCPSTATYAKVYLNDSSVPLTVGVGIPNITALYDYRPSLWAIGTTIVSPPGYQTDADRTGAGIPSSSSVFQPVVPRGLKAVEYPSAASEVFAGFQESSSGISGFGLLSVNVTVSAPGTVYLVMQPLENRRARAFISIGTEETATPEPGSSSELQEQAWFTDGVDPTMGALCAPASA